MEKNNPPAFPLPLKSGSHAGMTLRDYFAGQALAGMCASQWFPDHGKHESGDMGTGLAANAYSYADAMLAARKEQS